MDCPESYLPSPNASFAYSCYGITREMYPSLHQCVDRCAADGAVPACITSSEEMGFLHSIVSNFSVTNEGITGLTVIDSAWIGLYKDISWRCDDLEGVQAIRTTGNSPSAEARGCALSGWDFCIDGSTPRVTDEMWGWEGNIHLNENPSNKYGWEYCSLLDNDRGDAAQTAEQQPDYARLQDVLR